MDVRTQAPEMGGEGMGVGNVLVRDGDENGSQREGQGREKRARL